jgi:hypothetical protein
MASASYIGIKAYSLDLYKVLTTLRLLDAPHKWIRFEEYVGSG